MSKHHYIILRASSKELLDAIAAFVAPENFDGPEVPTVLTFDQNVFIRETPNENTTIGVGDLGEELDVVNARGADYFQLQDSGLCPFCQHHGNYDYEERCECNHCGGRWSDDGRDHAPTHGA
jgi:hypothetical protein